MQIDGSNHIDPVEWRNLLRQAVHDSKGSNRNKYIVVKKDKGYVALPKTEFDKGTKQLLISEIVDLSKRHFEQAKMGIGESKYLTYKDVKNFTDLGSDIVFYTYQIIEAKQAKRNQPLKRFVRGIALVLSALASITLIGIPFFILLRQGNKKFENEIDNLKENIWTMNKEMKDLLQQKFEFDKGLLTKELNYPSTLLDQLLSLEDDIPQLIDRMHELKDGIEGLEEDEENRQKLESQLEKTKEALKSYVEDIQHNETALGLSFKHAAKYVHLKKEFLEIQIPQFNETTYEMIVQNAIEGIYNDQLVAFFKLPLKERPAVMEQFKKDIPRKNSFLRIDATRDIHDKVPNPTPQSKMKISDAARAIAQLISTAKDQDWIPILQLAVVQTNLNGAFLAASGTLIELGSQVVWDDEGKEYRLLPAFPEGLPPTKLEIIRDKEGSIQQVKIMVEGSLNLVKTSQSENSPEEDPTEAKVIVEDAVVTSLSYTLTMEKGRPIISDFKCESTTRIPPSGDAQA